MVGLAVAAGPGLREAWFPPDPRPTDRWAAYLRLAPGSGWRVNEQVVSLRSETVGLVRDTPVDEAVATPSVCTVSLTNAELPHRQKGERSVRVRHRPGVVGRPEDGPAVRWAYADGGLAALSCPARTDPVLDQAGPADAEELLTLADAVRFGTVPVQVPFRSARIQASFAPAWVSTRPGPPAVVSVSYTGTSGPWADAALTVTMDHEAATAIGPTGDGRLRPGQRAITLGDRTAYVEPDFGGPGLPRICTTEPSGRVCVHLDWNGSTGDLEHLGAAPARLVESTLSGLSLAPDFNDPATWFEADVILR